MNSQMKKFLSVIFFIVITISTHVLAQEKAKPVSTKHDMKKMDCCKDKSTSEKTMDCKKGTETIAASKINVVEIDKNKDGIIYQCPMCPDQVADEPGRCSKCEMDLKEVSLNDAQKTLDKKTGGMMDDSKMDHSKMMSHEMKHPGSAKMEMKKDNIVREGEIDLITLDKNKDGKVFQDMMDWNVISDEAGECPLCRMKLKEVTLEKAKENLLKHNIKIINTVEQK